MDIQVLTYPQLDRVAWTALLSISSTATFFQTPACYDFYASLPFMEPFAYGVEQDGELVGVMQGYITRETNPIKQWLTRRAIIIGGPLLAENIQTDALLKLLVFVRQQLRNKAIYLETRNFHDYSAYRSGFEQAGWNYQPHLNFHVDTSSMDTLMANMGKSRKRDVKTSLRDGAQIIEKPTLEQLKDYYAILLDLYQTKVKTPLFPFCFFEKLYALSEARFLLVEWQGEIIGGTVCVVLEGKAMYEWFACGKDGISKSIFPSTLATYAGMAYAAEHRLPLFDMMGAGKPEESYGVRDFKAKFGGELVEHGRYLCVCQKLLYQIGKWGVSLMKRR